MMILGNRYCFLWNLWIVYWLSRRLVAVFPRKQRLWRWLIVILYSVLHNYLYASCDILTNTSLFIFHIYFFMFYFIFSHFIHLLQICWFNNRISCLFESDRIMSMIECLCITDDVILVSNSEVSYIDHSRTS